MPFPRLRRRRRDSPFRVLRPPPATVLAHMGLVIESLTKWCNHRSQSGIGRSWIHNSSMLDLHNRRAFLRAAMAAGAAWAAADLTQVEDALAWAHDQSAAPAALPPLSALTRAQASVIEAMTVRI